MCHRGLRPFCGCIVRNLPSRSKQLTTSPYAVFGPAGVLPQRGFVALRPRTITNSRTWRTFHSVVAFPPPGLARAAAFLLPSQPPPQCLLCSPCLRLFSDVHSFGQWLLDSPSHKRTSRLQVNPQQQVRLGLGHGIHLYSGSPFIFQDRIQFLEDLGTSNKASLDTSIGVGFHEGASWRQCT